MSNRHWITGVRLTAPRYVYLIALMSAGMVGLFSLYMRFTGQVGWVFFVGYAVFSLLIALIAKRVMRRGDGFHIPFAGTDDYVEEEKPSFEYVEDDLTIVRMFFSDKYNELRSSGKTYLEADELEQYSLQPDRLANLFTACLYEDISIFDPVEVRPLKKSRVAPKPYAFDFIAHAIGSNPAGQEN